MSTVRRLPVKKHRRRNLLHPPRIETGSPASAVQALWFVRRIAYTPNLFERRDTVPDYDTRMIGGNI